MVVTSDISYVKPSAPSQGAWKYMEDEREPSRTRTPLPSILPHKPMSKDEERE